MALQCGPPLVLAGFTGWVADRFERRRILYVTQSALMTLAIVVGILLQDQRSAARGRKAPVMPRA